MAVLNHRDKDEIIERVERLINRTDKRVLVRQLVEDAAKYVLRYTNRTEIPYELYDTIGDLAIVKWNRLGTQGDLERSEGGESYKFSEKPKEIYDVLNLYRLVRVGGHAFEEE